MLTDQWRWIDGTYNCDLTTCDYKLAQSDECDSALNSGWHKFYFESKFYKKGTKSTVIFFTRISFQSIIDIGLII